MTSSSHTDGELAPANYVDSPIDLNATYDVEGEYGDTWAVHCSCDGQIGHICPVCLPTVVTWRVEERSHHRNVRSWGHFGGLDFATKAEALVCVAKLKADPWVRADLRLIKIETRQSVEQFMTTGLQ